MHSSQNIPKQWIKTKHEQNKRERKPPLILIVVVVAVGGGGGSSSSSSSSSNSAASLGDGTFGNYWIKMVLLMSSVLYNKATTNHTRLKRKMRFVLCRPVLYSIESISRRSVCCCWCLWWWSRLSQLSSVQFKPMCSGKPVCTPTRLAELFPSVAFETPPKLVWRRSFLVLFGRVP